MNKLLNYEQCHKPVMAESTKPLEIHLMLHPDFFALEMAPKQPEVRDDDLEVNSKIFPSSLTDRSMAAADRSKDPIFLVMERRNYVAIQSAGYRALHVKNYRDALKIYFKTQYIVDPPTFIFTLLDDFEDPADRELTTQLIIESNDYCIFANLQSETVCSHCNDATVGEVIWSNRTQLEAAVDYSKAWTEMQIKRLSTCFDSDNSLRKQFLAQEHDQKFEDFIARKYVTLSDEWDMGDVLDIITGDEAIQF